MNQNALAPLAGLLCPLLFIVFIVAAIILAFRRARAARRTSGSSGPSAPALTNVPTLVAEDGFWIESCPANTGSIICYQYWSDGTRYSGRIPFKPEAHGRQFVYTGRRPERVSIVRVVEVDDDDLSSTLIPPIVGSGTTWDPPDMSPTTSDPPSSSPSFPSAY